VLGLMFEPGWTLAAMSCGLARSRVPRKWEAVGHLIADLIFGCECPGDELVLYLPWNASFTKRRLNRHKIQTT